MQGFTYSEKITQGKYHAKIQEIFRTYKGNVQCGVFCMYSVGERIKQVHKHTDSIPRLKSTEDF